MKDILNDVFSFQIILMTFLTLEENFLETKGAILTAKEIAGQPELWKNVVNDFFNAGTEIKNFLRQAYQEADNIILTGAGTSAFIGLSLCGAHFIHTGIITRAIATTDIVSHPHDYFNEQHTPLIISFARSGNSPESVAALELADKLSAKCFHFIITCNDKGELSKYNSRNPTCVFVLPEEANDKSLAMTGSYSSMLLAGLMIAYINHPQKVKHQVELLIQAAENIFSHSSLLKKIAEKDFKRAMFLGAGNLFGTATETALKLQELTNGKIICKEDTYLGLRHGPKAVINNKTLVMYFFSNNEYANRYEQDLVKVMKTGNNVLFQLGVSEKHEAIKDLDAQINFGVEGEKIDQDFLPVCAIITGQLLGFYKSLEHGLMPDNPSVNGAISRVVQGVKIYPLEQHSTELQIINNE